MTMLITDKFVSCAQSWPNKTAVNIGNTSISYGELLSAVRKVSRIINTIDFSKSRNILREPVASQCIGLLLNNSLEFIELFLGASMSGSLAMVMDPQWNPIKTHKLLSAFLPDILFVDFTLLDETVSDLASRLRAVSVGGTKKTVDVNYIDWRESIAEKPKESKKASAETPFYIGFTSGMTGDPKGFIRSHKSWIASFGASSIEFGTNHNDRILAPGPLVHSLTLYSAIEGLSAGSTVYLLHKFNVQEALKVILVNKITVLVAVPTMLKSIFRMANKHKLKFSTVRAVISGGAKLDPVLREQLREVFSTAMIFEFYGTSELSFVSVLSSEEMAPLDSIGRPFSGVEISIKNQKTREKLHKGEVGKIWVKSDFICSGYLNSHDDINLEIDQGWASVGDLGWCDELGYIHLLGRSKEMLISGGLKVYPLELELALRRFEEISEAVVIGIPDDYWGDLICAVISWEGKEHLTRKQLRQRLMYKVERYKLPRRFFVIEQLPLNKVGKVLRTDLREHILSKTPGIQEIR